MNGLVLTAGGARGAYQAGVLKRMGEMPAFRSGPSPFSIVTGASAGAINGAAVAGGSDDFAAATRALAELWGTIRSKDVFKTDVLSLGLGSARWLKDLTLGGLVGGGGNAQSLLDFTPLRAHLERNLSFGSLARSIESGRLYALAISATNYYSGQSFTFIQGQKGHPLWEKSRRTALSVDLTVDHVWASCAIPVIFQPVLVPTPIGDFYFGDGGLRLVAPFSSAIRLGARRVFAVGIRSQKSAEQRLRETYLETGQKLPRMKRPPLAQIFGVTLNSIFLDHLDTDFEHLKRMNELLRSYGADVRVSSKPEEPMRIVEPFVISPSADLAKLAEQYHRAMPAMIRYMMEGLGTTRSQSADLMSYLLFDSAYTRALIDIGYRDASDRADEIEHFFRSG